MLSQSRQKPRFRSDGRMFCLCPCRTARLRGARDPYLPQNKQKPRRFYAAVTVTTPNVGGLTGDRSRSHRRSGRVQSFAAQSFGRYLADGLGFALGCLFGVFAHVFALSSGWNATGLPGRYSSKILRISGLLRSRPRRMTSNITTIAA